MSYSQSIITEGGRGLDEWCAHQNDSTSPTLQLHWTCVRLRVPRTARTGENAVPLPICRLSPSFSYLHVYADGKLRHSAESGLKMVNKKGRARSTNFSCPFSPPSLCSPRGLGWVRFRISVDWDHFRDFLSKYINPCSPDPIPSNVSEAKIVRTQVRYGFAQLAWAVFFPPTELNLCEKLKPLSSQGR